jgi:AmmeMemoRadiSam system protein B
MGGIAMKAARPAAVAGLFYPAEAQTLRARVAQLLAAAGEGDMQGFMDRAENGPRSGRTPPEASGRPPKLLIVPHAGYDYSGLTAAHAYAQLAPWRERYRRVVLLGPAHREPLRGLAAPASSEFLTPLGAVPVDDEALAALADLPQVVRTDRPHADEHALEVQLPFLQTMLGRFALAPLAVGTAGADEVATVLERLWGGDETLVIISSDLSHYLPYERARERDFATVQRILALDPVGVDDACGAYPINGALQIARRRALVPRLLDLRNSGDTAGDRWRVVGYASIAFEEVA